jgi:hypothetical protein
VTGTGAVKTSLGGDCHCCVGAGATGCAVSIAGAGDGGVTGAGAGDGAGAMGGEVVGAGDGSAVAPMQTPMRGIPMTHLGAVATDPVSSDNAAINGSVVAEK